MTQYVVDVTSCPFTFYTKILRMKKLCNFIFYSITSCKKLTHFFSIAGAGRLEVCGQCLGPTPTDCVSDCYYIWKHGYTNADPVHLGIRRSR